MGGGELEPNRHFQPSAWEDPDHPTTRSMDAAGYLPPLAESEVESLLAGEPLPNPAAELHDFETVAEFQQLQNNFSTFFTSGPRSLDRLVKRRIKAFQRYELLYPERVTALGSAGALRSEWSSEHWQALLAAYRDMRQLTSHDDPEIQPHGTVDAWFLTR